jgi:broad specificity phosphatase PhoE
MRIVWARHGENVANLDHVFSYQVVDGDLTDRGRKQADTLGQHLARANTITNIILTSPLRRARQTAEIVSCYLNAPRVLILEELRELNVGTLDGRRDAEAWKIYENVLERWRLGALSARFPGGEDGHGLARRIERALGFAAREARGEAVLIVAHGGNARAALPTLAGSPDPGRDLDTGETALLDVKVTEAEDLAVSILRWGRAR